MVVGNLRSCCRNVLARIVVIIKVVVIILIEVVVLVEAGIILDWSHRW